MKMSDDALTKEEMEEIASTFVPPMRLRYIVSGEDEDVDYVLQVSYLLKAKGASIWWSNWEDVPDFKVMEQRIH